MASRSPTTAALAPRPPAKPGAASPPQSRVAYDRRRPELTALHQAVAEGWPQLRELVREQVQAPLPRFVERGFEAYLACGQLAAGLTRCRCRDCGSEYVVVSAAGPPSSRHVFSAGKRAESREAGGGAWRARCCARLHRATYSTRASVPSRGGQAVARGGSAGVLLAPGLKSVGYVSRSLRRGLRGLTAVRSRQRVPSGRSERSRHLVDAAVRWPLPVLAPGPTRLQHVAPRRDGAHLTVARPVQALERGTQPRNIRS